MSLWEIARPEAGQVALVAANAATAADAGLLRAAMASAIAAGHLAALPLDGMSVAPVVTRKRRWVVTVTVDDGVAATKFVVKGFAAGVAPGVQRNHEALGAAVWPSSAATSRPLGQIPALNAVVTEFAAGRHPGLCVTADATAAGRAAAALHTCGASLSPRLDVDRVMDNVARHARLLERADADLRELADAIVNTARARSSLVESARYAPIHGDLSFDALLIGESTVTLIDWDTACMFDPAWDIGHCVAQLVRFGSERNCDTRASTAAFVASYLEAADHDPDIVARARFYEYLTYVHKAYTVWRQRRAAGVAFAFELLGWASEGLKAL